MSVIEDHLPYRQKGLENLAVALGRNSAYLWINPATNALSLKEEADARARRQPQAMSSELSEELP